MQNGRGAELKATLTLGPWLRGSDEGALERAWYDVSGEYGMPLVSGAYPPTGVIKQERELDSAAAAYIFGSLTLESVQAGQHGADFFDAFSGEWSVPSQSYLYIDQHWTRWSDSFWEAGMLFSCVRRTCNQNIDSPLFTFSDYRFSDNSASSSIPFVAAVPRVFGPDAIGWELHKAKLQFVCPAAGVFDKAGGITPGSGDHARLIPTEVAW